MRIPTLLRGTLLLLALASAAHAAPTRASLTVNSVSPGPTPFISMLDVTVSPPDAIKGIRFTVQPKPFSVTRAISASYSSDFLRSHGYLNTSTGHLTLPVFGLYENFDNTVTLTTDFRQGPSADTNVQISTPDWADSTGSYVNPAVLLPRSTSTNLSYDFIMLKGFQDPISPVIMDTDGEVRWIGVAGIASISAIFYDNSIFVSQGAGIARQELYGTWQHVADYSGMGVNFTGHHNYDRGRDGILVEVNENDAIESTILEVDPSGPVLRTWRVADILRQVMIAGGDDPSAFIRAPDDWFHNNASTYDRAQNAIIISGREDFVIALDYDTGAVKWILGDPTKAWYQYPSLRRHALTLLDGTLPPIGQHAVSVAHDGDLLLFDNGRASLNQNPPGADRSYSAPRKYHVNPRKMTAIETWSYEPSPSLYSPYCSSVYEDARNNYLMDFTLAGDLIGIDGRGETVFHYLLSTAYFCNISWNAAPVHLENIEYR